MNRTYIRHLLLLALYSVVACESNNTSLLTRCEAILPVEMIEIIREDFPGWAILENNDLDPDDRELWNSYHGTEKCVGVVHDIFGPPLTDTYAVLLVRSRPSDIDIQLLLFNREDVDWTISSLYNENSIARAPVIFRGEPGTYRDFYDRDQLNETFTHSLIYEHIEASSIAFIFVEGTVRQVLISD